MQVAECCPTAPRTLVEETSQDHLRRSCLTVQEGLGIFFSIVFKQVFRESHAP